MTKQDDDEEDEDEDDQDEDDDEDDCADGRDGRVRPPKTADRLQQASRGPSGAIERCFDDVDMSVSLSGDRYRGINGGGWRLMAASYTHPCSGLYGRQDSVSLLLANEKEVVSPLCLPPSMFLQLLAHFSWLYQRKVPPSHVTRSILAPGPQTHSVYSHARIELERVVSHLYALFFFFRPFSFSYFDPRLKLSFFFFFFNLPVLFLPSLHTISRPQLQDGLDILPMAKEAEESVTSWQL
ncbi:hypothetical protein TRV_03578 [Trichophyton verrucosum HKI 0517]|uniref:Uncharacterized protein n=1 Tax=Trichophyton verrucosum (strain HKI 0517) TaxID=663202 RepID=D4D8Z0_TRIVH|nr:uncharacterized protein TRV_03578 [Trichophyton verrucosum HKI 0517]EFE41749.1 hypothetical protein TRV_03578 [Trichophyton verrucosum HKI 0517]